MTPCRPIESSIKPLCRVCSRLNQELPHNPELRGKVVLLDASTIRVGDVCPMFEESLMNTRNCHFHLFELTDRELECLRYIASGLGHKQIAFEMEITRKTIEHYAEKVRSKLCVRTTAQAVLKAERAGLLKGIEV
jgi:ATP/maltotriose-dependent transcriptional regulator MalT